MKRPITFKSHKTAEKFNIPLLLTHWQDEELKGALFLMLQAG